VKHRALARWLQPGGHLERGESPLAAARREAREETGAAALQLLDWHADGAEARALPLDIDVHPIPARPERGEPAHLHLDFRYVFRLADEGALQRQIEEVDALRWEPLDALAAGDVVPGLGRAARKLAAVLRGAAAAEA
jgi:8-oxo-dGTP pyrophosphatase MutT (NUDIX family)